MPTGIEEAAAVLSSAAAYAFALVQEPWTRYIIINVGTFGSSLVGSLTGVFPLESLLSFLVSNIFQVQGFAFPVYYGISSLLVITVTYPLILWLARTAMD